MTVDRILQAKVLNVYCRELNADIYCRKVEPSDANPDGFEWDKVDGTYEFECYEFENGLILVLDDTSNDWFFSDRSSVEANGSAVVDKIEETGDTVEFSTKELLESVQGSMREFGFDSVPAKHLELWRYKHPAPAR